jgi:hypothetical protein
MVFTIFSGTAQQKQSCLMLSAAWQLRHRLQHKIFGGFFTGNETGHDDGILNPSFFSFFQGSSEDCNCHRDII